jgi:hypothetical protein
VHTGRAGANHRARELVITDGVLQLGLSFLGAHVLIIFKVYYARFLAQRLGHSLDVHSSGNVGTAPAYEYTDSLHSILLFREFSESGNQRLLRHFFIQHSGDVLGLEMILPLLTDDRQTNRFNELGRLHLTGTTLYASKTGEALIKSGGGHQGLDFSVFYHIYELVGMKFHFLVGGAGAAALAAFHTFAGVHAADSQNLFLQILVFHGASLFQSQGFIKKLGEIYYRVFSAVFLQIIKAMRDMVVHDGNYWEVQIFAYDEESVWLTHLETDLKILPENVFNYKDKLTTYHFETTLQYEKFIYYFVEACIKFINSYIDKTEEKQ